MPPLLPLQHRYELISTIGNMYESILTLTILFPLVVVCLVTLSPTFTFLVGATTLQSTT